MRGLLARFKERLKSRGKRKREHDPCPCCSRRARKVHHHFVTSSGLLDSVECCVLCIVDILRYTKRYRDAIQERVRRQWTAPKKKMRLAEFMKSRRVPAIVAKRKDVCVSA